MCESPERPQTINFELSWDALAPRRHPGSTQKAPGDTQEAPSSPGTSWSQNVSYHMRLRTKVMRVTTFATGAT